MAISPRNYGSFSQRVWHFPPEIDTRMMKPQLSTFLGKESTKSGKVVNLSQMSKSTFSVWIGKC